MTWGFEGRWQHATSYLAVVFGGVQGVGAQQGGSFSKTKVTH